MSQAHLQSGIMAEPNLHAQHLYLQVKDKDFAGLAQKLAYIVSAYQEIADDYFEAMANTTIAFSDRVWGLLYPGLRPLELSPLPELPASAQVAPDSQADIFIQLAADRADVVYMLLQQTLQTLGSQVAVLFAWQGFRYLNGRDLLGHVDAPDNPRASERLALTVVGAEDEDFAHGSYLLAQVFAHHSKAWQALTRSEQEAVLGFDMVTGAALDKAQIRSHLVRSRGLDLPDLAQGLRCYRQSMSYATVQQQGQLQMLMSNSANTLKQVLLSRHCGRQEQQYDRLLDYSQAVAGGLFFAPSKLFMQYQGR